MVEVFIIQYNILNNIMVEVFIIQYNILNNIFKY